VEKANKLLVNRIVFIGGTDAGGWYIGADGKIHRFPGWNPEQMFDVAHALDALREVSQIKSKGVADRVIATVGEFVKGQLGEHLQSGDVLVIGR
jgi:hypothetical protein